jgi:Co/Zn/Cd efflux system component
MTMVIERPARGQTDRLFFTGMALASAFAVFVGFMPTYFIRSAALPVLTPLYHLHGALFSSWIILLVAQTSLVAARRTDIHRRLGVVGAVLAAIVFIVGVTVSIETMRRGGGPPGIDARTFFAVPLGDIIAFGALVTAAVMLRHHRDSHKRLMLLATISLLTAAVGRFLVQVQLAGPLGLFLGTDVFVLAVVLYDFMSLGRVHPATLWGGAMVAVFKPLLFAAAFTPPWLAFADTLR